MGYAGRLVVRFQRWAALTLGTGTGTAHGLMRAAYMQGARDALDAVMLAERERLAEVYRTQRTDRGDTVAQHAAIANGIRRCIRQAEALARLRREGASEAAQVGGARRLARLRAELAYLAGEGRPDACSLAGPGRAPVAASAFGMSQSTDKEDDDVGIESDPRREWYADDGERADQLREQRQKQLHQPDEQIPED